MIAYKLFRQMKDGSITSLFINKTRKLPLNKWLESENHPTKGYKERPFWHCTKQPNAPHLTTKGRVWMKIEMKNFEIFNRPTNQGGVWYLAKQIKIIGNE